MIRPYDTKIFVHDTIRIAYRTILTTMLKYTAIAELFYVTIYTQVFTIWFKESKKEMVIFMHI